MLMTVESRPCKKCGGVERYASGKRRCKTCAAAASFRYFEKLKDKPCAKCGGTTRYTNGQCSACARLAGEKSIKLRVEKPCTKCGAFDWYPSGTCRPCSLAFYAQTRDRQIRKTRAWQRKNPERTAQLSYKSRIKKYGWTVERADRAWALQRGICALGGHALASLESACHDHDHDTLKPRSLICDPCNLLEGHCKGVNYDPALCGSRIIEYVNFYKTAGPDEIFTFDAS